MFSYRPLALSRFLTIESLDKYIFAKMTKRRALNASDCDGDSWLGNEDPVLPAGPWRAWEAPQQAQGFTQEVPAMEARAFQV